MKIKQKQSKTHKSRDQRPTASLAARFAPGQMYGCFTTGSGRLFRSGLAGGDFVNF